MLVVVRMPPTNQLLYILVIFVLSYLGGFLSQVAFNVISYECEYFQIAFRRHIKAENRLFADPEPLPLRNWQAPTMWSLLVKFSAKGGVEMCWELFTWGNDVEIVAPQSLKDTFSELVDGLNDAAEKLVS